ncbi:unnamed protein product [Cuscuta campestris]|uniref:HECT-type E3 ubiquitin transferase n=1 Tax=Cuscuta campestris TaxID=132261 RepID=A0A484K8Z0_9ASTE|nr:unnamed protein product [Cuscuta campestris]
MFFSGDPSSRKRVDLGGRSSKERDRQKLVEQARQERNRRQHLRQQNSAAIKVQKFFRGRKAVEAAHSRVRKSFFKTYGDHCQNVQRQSFAPDSDFLRQLLFFLNPTSGADFSVLVEACQSLREFTRDTGDIASIFGGMQYDINRALVDYRVKKLAYACTQALYANRTELKDQLLERCENLHTPIIILLDTVHLLIDPRLPWACRTVTYLIQRNIYSLFRELIVTWKERIFRVSNRVGSSLESIIVIIMSHVGQPSCSCPILDSESRFPSQILTIPFLWHFFPHLKEIFATPALSQHYIHQMALCVKDHSTVLPPDTATDLPGYGCLLGNLLDVGSLALTQPNSFDMAIDFAIVSAFLLEALPSLRNSSLGSKGFSQMADDEMIIGDEPSDEVLNLDLEQQISKAMEPSFLLQLINVFFGRSAPTNAVQSGQFNEKVAEAVGAACVFLHVIFNILDPDRIMTIIAYRTELVPALWNFMKQCHESQNWSLLSGQSTYLPADAPGWLLPLAAFCPVYKHMLMVIDNEEFYEQEKPLSLKDIKTLIVILRQALWQIMWLNPVHITNVKKHVTDRFNTKRNHVDFIQNEVCVVASELLSKLQDWNNRRQFTSPSDFHADGVNEHFISSAMMENTRVNDILKQAPFLVPFTSRAKIFNFKLASSRERNGSQAVFARTKLKIRRDHILEDSFDQLNKLSDDDLRGLIRVTFINEFGVEEAGIDGGGIFKDFMENITRAAFDIQYGLFKETADHLLYPNPGSGLIHEHHLQYFKFLGVVLAKAIFEGILVDIPFATFFLSKLKQKHIYLNDLPSLDPELYHHLIFLKHYEGNLSDLELYFVVVNNEYGEQKEEELLTGGKSMRVTNENVITFIHLVANHRLNAQIREQSSHFLRGFQVLIQKDWIDMFNEHELQLLISGAVDGIDVENLRAHTNYTGGYHKDHYVIEMFWEVVKNFSLENQRNFLKFVTGCSRGPLLGFNHLEPKFCIQRAAGITTDEAIDRLPTSATCMNLLKLPPYRSKEQMEEKLLYAISAEAGFDLS